VGRVDISADEAGAEGQDGGLVAMTATDAAAILDGLQRSRVHVLAGWPATGALPCDVVRVLDGLADTGTALEIRADGDGPDEQVIRLGRDRGVRFLLNAPPTQMRYALDRARRGWLEPQHVVNAFDRPALDDWLAARST
jgi:histidinol phosphatase-like PHP family hydrolase